MVLHHLLPSLAAAAAESKKIISKNSCERFLSRVTTAIFFLLPARLLITENKRDLCVFAAGRGLFAGPNVQPNA
jgi:hypothetical protein